MAIIPCVHDGFEWNEFSIPWPGNWADRTNAASNTEETPLEIYMGTYEGRKFRGVLEFGPINLNRGESLSRFNIKLIPRNMFQDVDLRIRAVLNSKIRINASNLVSRQQLTTAQRQRSMAQYAGFVSNGQWLPDSGEIIIGVREIAQEVIDSFGWSYGDSITFDFNYSESTTTGRIQIRSQEHPSVIGAEADVLTTTDSGSISVTRVNGNNTIRSGDVNILVEGSGFNGLQYLRIFKGSNSEFVTVNSFNNEEIRFNYAGSLPVGENYNLEIKVDQSFFYFNIEILPEVTEGNPVFQETLEAADDGFEWRFEDGSWPGTWASVSGSASGSPNATNSLVLGVYSFPFRRAKAAVKIGPIQAERNQKINYFNLNLNVSSAFKYVDMNIKAVSNPDAPDLGPSNLPSNSNLTTAVKNEQNSSWVNSSTSSGWIPASNPKNVSVTAVAQEVVNNANWSKGDYIWFVIDFTLNADNQGSMTLWSTKSLTNDATTGSYQVTNGASITSVSNDNILEIGELNVTIIGTNLSGATNLVIEKGAIVEPQTIKTNNNTSLTFDVSTGNIVVGTGYTVSFTANGLTLSAQVEFVAAGASNVANVNGGNTIQTGDTATILGNGLSSATNVIVRQGTLSSNQSIISKDDARIIVNVERGPLGYGPAVMTVLLDGSEIEFNIMVSPEPGRDYVVIGQDFIGDNSLVFSASPAFSEGDQIEFSRISQNGFRVVVDANGVPQINGGSGTDTFLAASWDKSAGLWYDVETITFNEPGYFEENIINTKYFSYDPISDGDLSITRSNNSVPLETWIEKTPASETWNKK